jgi:hypothetical protein
VHVRSCRWFGLAAVTVRVGSTKDSPNIKELSHEYHPTIKVAAFILNIDSSKFTSWTQHEHLQLDTVALPIVSHVYLYEDGEI